MLSDSIRSDGNCSVIIDLADLICPVLFERYTEQNYPVTLPCGHTLSIEAFDAIRKRSLLCPMCKEEFSMEFHPQKTIVWGNVANQIRNKTPSKLYCDAHPKEEAIALCFEEKVLLCLECYREDKHSNDVVVTLKKLINHLQEKSQNLQTSYERTKQIPINDQQVKDVTKIVLARIQPFVEQVVRKELRNFIVRLEEVDDLIEETETAIEKKMKTGIVELVKKLEEKTENLENMKMEDVLQKNVHKTINKVVGLMRTQLRAINSKLEQSLSSSLNIEDRAIDLRQLPDRESCQKLELNFGDKFKDISRTSLDFADFGKLSHLKLVFNKCKIDDSAVKEVTSYLHNITSLNTLEITFRWCNNISDMTAKELASLPQIITSLTTLHLAFDCCNKIKDTSVKEIASALKEINSITTLGLDFNSCVGDEISDEAVRELGSALMNLTVLTNVGLSFENCDNITDVSLRKLSLALKDLTSLTLLNLTFNRCSKISNAGIKELVSVLKNKTFLSDLFFSFEGCGWINNTTITEFSSALKDLTSLTDLQMNFKFCDKISDAGVEELASAIKNIPSLTTLGLSFENCEEITDVGVNKISSALSNISWLTNLALVFGGCYEISDVAVKELSCALKNMTPLSLLYLDFNRCNQIGNESAKELSSVLNKMMFLTDLKIDFSGCSQISPETKKGLQEILAHCNKGSSVLSSFSSAFYVVE